MQIYKYHCIFFYIKKYCGCYKTSTCWIWFLQALDICSQPTDEDSVKDEEKTVNDLAREMDLKWLVNWLFNDLCDFTFPKIIEMWVLFGSTVIVAYMPIVRLYITWCYILFPIVKIVFQIFLCFWLWNKLHNIIKEWKEK